MSRDRTVRPVDVGRIEPFPRPMTAFVGRHRDLASVNAVLRHAQVVCLTGPAGCGKTRLAIEVARAEDEQSPGTVCWVDLAPLRTADALPRALANALGVREAAGRELLDSIIAHLADAPHLLMLDSCEHLLPDCSAIVRRLLTECPTLRVVATSRELLGLVGERVWQVVPLTFPAADVAPSPDALLEYESVQLFCERAEIALPGFRLDERTAGAIARISRGLEGLALAIELAAARVRVLSVQEIADGLENRLAMLTAAGYAATDRHRSLRVALDWSHRLLTEPERRLFAELAVFTGGFSLDAVRAVHLARDGEPDVLELVAHLVDRSLVSAAVDVGPARYSLPETIRMYAGEHLERTGGSVDARQRLVRWCVEFAERAEREVFGPDQVQWLDRIEVERANLGVALRWSLGDLGAPQDGLRIVAALWRFCYLRGYYTEGRAWSDAALDATETADTPPLIRARALAGAGDLAFLQCSYAQAGERLDAALAVYREMSDEKGMAGVLHTLGGVAREQGRYEASLALHTESLTLSRRLGDVEGIARSENYLSLLAWLQDDLVAAATLGEQALRRYRVVGDGEGVAWSLINLAASACYDGHPDQARELLQESLSRSRAIGYCEGTAWSLNLLGLLALDSEPQDATALLRDSLREHWSLGDSWRTASVLEALAAVDARAGETERAGRLLGAAAGLRDAVGAPAPPVERRLILETTARIEQRLGADGRRDAERLGRLSAVESVVEGLLREPEPQAKLPHRDPVRLADRVSRIGVTTLGGCRIHLGDVPVTAADFGYAKPRELLCFLLDRGEVTKEQIGIALWPWTSSARLRSSFHTTLHHLRSAVGADRVVFADGRYRFDRSLPYSYDVEAFENLIAGSRQDDADLSAAIELYRGDYLVDLVGEAWIDDRRGQLRRAYARTLSTLARRYTAAGQHDDATDVLHRAVEHDPLSEAAQRELMGCYYAAGQRAMALRQYRTLSDLLRDELNTAPAPETLALLARIRRTDVDWVG